MEVNESMVNKLAQLARLEFNETEKTAIRADLQRMIQFVQKMEEVNTDDVAPLLHITAAKNVLRKDEVRGEVTVEEAMKNAAVNDGTFFKVPKVIKK